MTGNNVKGERYAKIKVPKVDEITILIKLLTGPKRVYEMARELNVKPSYVSKVLKKLREKGFVEKDAEGRYVLSSEGYGYVTFGLFHLKFIHDTYSLKNTIEMLSDVANKSHDEFTKDFARRLAKTLTSIHRVDMLMLCILDIISSISDIVLKMKKQLKDGKVLYLSKEFDKLWFYDLKYTFMNLAMIISSFKLNEWGRLMTYLYTIYFALRIASHYEEHYSQLIKSLQKQYSEKKG
jgi:Mn-dependent DtxR family transcriptional regulator